MMEGKGFVITPVLSPCSDCTERATGCHGKCEAYAAYRVKCDEAIRQRHDDSDFNDYLRDALKRMPTLRKI